jgi:uncharacterized protein (DUF302 family)
MNMSKQRTTIPYGKVVTTSLGFEAAVERARDELKSQGFGVLCDIDVTKTLHEKIGAAFRPYRILGACNPQFAHRALEGESQLGLLLPCNVVVQEEDGETVVSAIDARALLGVVHNAALSAVAEEVNARLHRVLEALEHA